MKNENQALRTALEEMQNENQGLNLRLHAQNKIVENLQEQVAALVSQIKNSKSQKNEESPITVDGSSKRKSSLIVSTVL